MNGRSHPVEPEERNAWLRRARQALQTDRLLGVDFVPRPRGGRVHTGRMLAEDSHDAAISAVAPSGDDLVSMTDASDVVPPRGSGVRSAAGEEETSDVSRRATMPGGGRGRARSSTATFPAGDGSDLAERERALEALRSRHDAECPHCTVATAHTQTVFGEGNPVAALMFIGEAPGETEDQLGRPFVGRAGQKLDEIIQAMGMKRSDVYIANVLKSRPPGNRTPLQHEIDACGPFLREQIRIIRPRVLVTLGSPATRLMLDTKEGISRLRGVWNEYRDGDLVIPVMPTYHPAYLLRNYTVETRRQVWSDMQAVLKRLGS